MPIVRLGPPVLNDRSRSRPDAAPTRRPRHRSGSAAMICAPPMPRCSRRTISWPQRASVAHVASGTPASITTRRPCLPPEAGRVDGALHVEPVVEQVDHELQMALRLHEAAADPESGCSCTVFAASLRGMIVWNGRLPGARRFGMRGIERESRAAVLHRETEALGDVSAAEIVVHAVDERNGVAVRVGRRQDRPYRSVPRPRPPAPTQSSPAACARRRAGARPARLRSADRRHGRCVWIIPCFIASIRRCQHSGESRAWPTKSTVGQRGERDQRSQPLAIGRAFEDAIALVVDADRVLPLRAVGREIVAARAIRPHRANTRRDARRSRPRRTRRARLRRRGAGCCARSRCTSTSPAPRCAPVDQQRARRFRVAAQQRLVVRQLSASPGATGKPSSRIFDRRLQRPRASERRPCAASICDQPSTQPGTVQASGLWRGTLSSPRARNASSVAAAGAGPLALSAHTAAVAREVDQREGVAAEPGLIRLNDAEDRCGGNRRVDRIAAVKQHAHARQARERMRRRDHPAPRENRRAARVELLDVVVGRCSPTRRVAASRRRRSARESSGSSSTPRPGLSGTATQPSFDRHALVRQQQVDRRFGHAVFLEVRGFEHGIEMQRGRLDDAALPGVRHAREPRCSRVARDLERLGQVRRSG